MVRIVLADDHPIVREGLIPLIESEPHFVVVAEAEDGLDAVRAIVAHRPDVAVVDIIMPLLGGIEVTRQVRYRCPTTRVVILSACTDEAHVIEALHAGAHGYVLKTGRPRDLLEAITAAAAGRCYLSPPLSEADLDAYLARGESGTAGNPCERLTPREREVMLLTAEGHTAHRVAELLGISPRTVHTHRERLMRKLGLHRAAELIRFAAERSLVAQAPGLPARPGTPSEGPRIRTSTD